MLSNFLIAFFVLAFSFFAVQNSIPVTVQFGESIIENVPLYFVALGGLLIGLLIAWTVRMARIAPTASADAENARGAGNRTIDDGALAHRRLSTPAGSQEQEKF